MYGNQIDLAEFIYTWDSQNTNNTIYDNQNQAHITLVMNDGTTNSLRLIEGGYVGYDPMGWYFVKSLETHLICFFPLAEVIFNSWKYL